MSKANNLVFKGLHIVAWVIFVGLCIEAGALLVNFIISLFKPEVVKNLYQKLDLSQMYSQNKWAYFGMYGFVLTIAIMKAYLFYLVIKLTLKLNLSKPFNSIVCEQITQISYATLFIGLLSHVARQTSKYLLHHGYEIDSLNPFWVDSEAFIMMAAVVYVIAIIFKKGIEIQNENDLTV